MGAMKEIFEIVSEMRKGANAGEGKTFYSQREIVPSLAVAYFKDSNGEWMWIFNPITGKSSEHYRIDEKALD